MLEAAQFECPYEECMVKSTFLSTLCKHISQKHLMNCSNAGITNIDAFLDTHNRKACTLCHRIFNKLKESCVNIHCAAFKHENGSTASCGKDFGNDAKIQTPKKRKIDNLRNSSSKGKEKFQTPIFTPTLFSTDHSPAKKKFKKNISLDSDSEDDLFSFLKTQSPIASRNTVFNQPQSSSFSFSNPICSDARSLRIALDSSESTPENPSAELDFGSESFHQLIRTCPIRTISNIPKKCKKVFARELCHLITAFTTGLNQWEAYGKLMMFPKCVLGIAPKDLRSKASHNKTQTDFTMLKLSQWKEGHYSALWNDVLQANSNTPATHQKDSQKTQTSNNIARATRFVALGRFGDATKALTSEGFATIGSATLETILKKFPMCSLPVVEKDDTLSPLTVTESQVLKSLKSFPKGSGCGSDGLRASHLLATLDTPSTEDRERMLSKITFFVNFLLAGSLDPKLAQFVNAAPVYPIAKKDGGIRPIVVPEVWRRLVSKVAAAQVAADANAYLSPLQNGVAVKGGVEAIVHSVNRLVNLYGSDSTKCLLKVDFTNAFNLVNRQVFIEQVRQHFPSLAQWVEFCYKADSRMLLGNSEFLCKGGVHQGDPLGPLLFSLALHKLILEVEREVPQLLLNSWYLDDGTLIGSIPDVQKAWAIIRQKAGQFGLQVNASKSEVWWPSRDQNLHNAFPDIPGSGLGNGTEILGSAIGDNAYVGDFVNKKVQKVGSILSQLKLLEHHQSRYLLLKSCMSFAKMNYILRTTPGKNIQDSLEKFDDLILESVEDLIGGCITDKVSAERVGLPCKFGGLGILKTQELSDAAFLGSFCQTSDLHLRMIRNCDSVIRYPQLIQQTLERVNNVTPTTNANPIQFGEIEVKGQQTLMNRILSSKADKLLNNISNPRDKALVQATTMDYSSAMLHLLPFGAQRFGNDEWDVLLKHRLNLPIYGTGRRCQINQCKGWLDVKGDHAVSCGANGDTIRRHNKVRDALARIGRKAKLDVVVEESLNDYSNRRPGDVTFKDFSHGVDMVVDVRISNSLINPEQAALKPGVNALKAELEKINKYRDDFAGREETISFRPFVMETLGGYGTKTEAVIKKLARNIAGMDRITTREAEQRLRNELTVVMMKSTANMILRRM